MPAIGISSTFQALVSPGAGCVITEVTQDESKQIKTIRDSSGVTKQVGVLPFTEIKLSVKGKGAPALSLVAANANVSSGTAVVTSASVDESNEDFPDFSLEAMKWS
jgi:hypothetical protein